MKKNVFFCMLTAVIAAAGVLTSCDDKKSEMKVGAYTLFEQNGLLGLKDSTGQVVLAPKFNKVEENSEYSAVIATIEPSGESTIMVGGYPIIEDIVIDSIRSGVQGYAYIYSGMKGGVYLWEIGKTSVTGPFTEIKIIDDVIFLNTDGKWGATTTQHHGLAPRQYDKLFVVKNGSTMGVLVYDKTGYALYDKDGVSDGILYDTPSTELERELKKLGVTDNIGVITVNWPL